jgi:putative ABC transport system substrate-binding protein
VTTRRAFIRAICCALVTVPFATNAQPRNAIARIGLLAPNLTGNPRTVEAFLQGLRDLGYVEGRNVVIEYRSADGKTERLPALAAELVALKVDLIVATGGTLAALHAKQAAGSLPVVFIAVGDPVTSGLVSGLGRPGGNVTGLSLLFPELIGKDLEQLKRAVPGISRVAVLWQPGFAPEAAAKRNLEEANVAARALGVQLQFAEARSPADIDRVFGTISRSRVDALSVQSTPLFIGERKRLVALAAKNRLPTVFPFRDYVDVGGLMSYGPDLADMFRRAASYVDRILKGANPGDLPVEQPTKFELVINVNTANALGLTIPQSMLAQADEIIR